MEKNFYRILLIAPKCFPVNGAEAIVNIKLLRALSEDGSFVIDLVSRKNLRIVYPSDSIESYNVSLNSLNVIENKGGFSFLVLLQSICTLGVFRCIFPGCHWALRSLPIVKGLLKSNNYDFVLTKSSPSFLLGAYLKRKGVNWVASWNDPYPTSFYPSPYGKGPEHKINLLERLQLRQMKKADFHIFPTEALMRHMLTYLTIKEEKCYVVPHVVYEDSITHRSLTRTDGDNVLRIIHSGNLSSPRNPRPVINALSRIIKEKPDIRFLFTFLGKMEQRDQDYINSMAHLKDFIIIVPMVEYKKSLEMLQNQDVACVIEADCGIGGGVFLPTKVTDFMQRRMPMLAVSPQKGVLEELFNEGAIGYYCDIHNESSIRDALLSVYNDFVNHRLKRSCVPESFRPDSVVAIYKNICLRLRNNV